MSDDSLEALVARVLCHYPSGPSDFNSCCAAEMGEKRCQIGARAALAAIEASGNVVVPSLILEALMVIADGEGDAQTIAQQTLGECGLAVRPRDAAPREESDGT